MKIILVFYILLISLNSVARTIHVSRADGSQLKFYMNSPSVSGVYPIVFLVHGSACTSSYEMFEQSSPEFLEQGFGVVVLEKYGLDQNTVVCPKAYLENNTVPSRVNDHLLVSSYIRNHIKKWNGKLLWLGGSEGGEVSALAAPLVSETSMLVMLASGGGLAMYQELPIVFERLMSRQGATEQQIIEKKIEIKKQFSFSNRYFKMSTVCRCS